MTQEDKELLLKDLCARLPYGVKGIITYNGDKDIFTVKGIFNILFLSDTECCHVEDFKPYLRPMSSMAEEEYNELEVLAYGCDCVLYSSCFPVRCNAKFKTYNLEVINWLNAHHFDYSGLIEKGLAIAVTENNNPYK